MTVPVLGRPSLEDSYPSLANRSCTGGQAGWGKVERGGAPAREISFVSLVAYGPKVSDSALTMGGYSFWNQAGWFPTRRHGFISGFSILFHWSMCLFLWQYKAFWLQLPCSIVWYQVWWSLLLCSLSKLLRLRFCLFLFSTSSKCKVQFFYLSFFLFLKISL